MSKVYNYMILAVGLTLLLLYAGLPTGAEFFLDWLGLSGIASGIGLGAFYVLISALFVVGTGSGIAISFLIKSSSETYLVAPIALGIFTVLVGTFISILNFVDNLGFIKYLVSLIFIPLIFGFFIAIINFWRGGDN